MVNYYELLKIRPEASHEEIELAFAEFKKQLLKFSPGINLSEGELRSRKPDVWNAFEFLLDSTMRKEYDEVLERDRIHALYEAENKIKEEQEQRSGKKRKYIALGAVILIVVIYFVMGQVSSNSLPEKANWRTHYITDQVKVLLPSAIDSSDNFLPAYLLGYMKTFKCGVSKIEGFSVSVARFTLNGDYKISPKDAAYINSMEMQNLHNRFRKEDTAKINLVVAGYYGQLKKGTYQIDNAIRAYENYTLLNGSEVIKVIVNYVPDNTDHEKYSQMVFESLML
jgi:hypothetical protein